MTDITTSPERSNHYQEVIVNPAGETIALRFDVGDLLEAEVGPDWQQQISKVIEAGELKLRSADGHYTNRELGNNAKLGLVTVEGDEIVEQVPGVWALYKGPFREMMQKALPEGAEPLKTYDSPTFAIEGYAQKPVTEVSDTIQYRMEAHVDLRYTVVLVIDSPMSDSDGGRLVIGNKPNAQSVEEIKEDATYIMHRPGTLVCFSQGRIYPHFTEEITNPNTKRIVISLNYPPESEASEAAKELLRHIKGQ